MDLTNKTIAVTGASGMLGVYLCRALLSAGAKVRGVVRNPEKAAFLTAEGVEFAKADLAERDALTAAFQGCDAVVSNAALYRWYNQSTKDNMSTNMEGTENVYRAAGAAGVKRMVQISSFGVYKWGVSKTITESSAQLNGKKGQGGAYRASKQASEDLAFRLSEELGIATTAVRPGGIYGARDHNMTPYFEKLMKLPVLPLPQFKVPFVYAGDVAEAVVGALKNDDSAGRAYLTAGRSESLVDFFKAYRAARGKGAFVVPITPEFGLSVDCSRAAQDLGFSNVPYEEGLAAMRAEDKRHRQLVAGAQE